MLAALAVGLLTWGLGVAPWMALALAFSFAPYMLMKKKLDAPAAVSVTAEVALIAPFALALLVWATLGGQIFGRAGGWFGADLYSTLLLPVTGIITGLPLVLFSWGAQRVRLSTLGLVQYLNPTLQAFSAVLVMGEPFTPNCSTPIHCSSPVSFSRFIIHTALISSICNVTPKIPS
mgnify:CR=1 FL=1